MRFEAQGGGNLIQQGVRKEPEIEKNTQGEPSMLLLFVMNFNVVRVPGESGATLFPTVFQTSSEEGSWEAFVGVFLDFVRI